MGSLRITLCTSVLAAVALTPTAYAADGGGVSVTPAAPAPGSDVTLRVAGCTERTAVAVSTALVADARLTVADGALAGEGRIRSTLKTGVYAVKVTCGDADRTGTIRVRGSGGPPPASARPTVLASPVAPVQAGGGGAADLAAAEDRRTGPGTAQAVTGLVLAGVAAVVVALSGVRRSRGTD